MPDSLVYGLEIMTNKNAVIFAGALDLVGLDKKL
jgi:hypothetical protein